MSALKHSFLFHTEGWKPEINKEKLGYNNFKKKSIMCKLIS